MMKNGRIIEEQAYLYKSKKILFALGGFEVLNFFHSKLVGNAFEENNL